jgi:hypothetical protein
MIMDKLKFTVPLPCPLYHKMINWCLIIFGVISVIMIGLAIAIINLVTGGLIIDSATHYDVLERLIMVIFTVGTIIIDLLFLHMIFDFIQFDCIREKHDVENNHGKTI